MFRGVTVGDNTHRFRIKPHPLHKSLRFNFRCQSLSSLSMVILRRSRSHYQLVACGHFSFSSTGRVSRGKILNIPHERAAQCASAGTYSVCIAPTQRGQQFFKNSLCGRKKTASAEKELTKEAYLSQLNCSKTKMYIRLSVS